MSDSSRFNAYNVTISFSTCAVEPGACSRKENLDQTINVLCVQSSLHAHSSPACKAVMKAKAQTSCAAMCTAGHLHLPLNVLGSRSHRDLNTAWQEPSVIPAPGRACWLPGPRAQHRQQRPPAQGRSRASSRCRRRPRRARPSSRPPAAPAAAPPAPQTPPAAQAGCAARCLQHQLSPCCLDPCGCKSTAVLTMWTPQEVSERKLTMGVPP